MRLNMNAPPATAPEATLKDFRSLGPHPWALDELAKLRTTRAGEGVHTLLFRCAKGLAAYHAPGEIFTMLSDAVSNCGRFVPDSEVWEAIEAGSRYSHQPPIGAPASWVRPPVREVRPTTRDEGLIASVLTNGKTLDSLKASGGLFPDADSWEPRTDAFIDALFPDGDPLLCLGVSPAVFDTKPRSAWRGNVQELAFIVPSAMSAVEGRTKAGHVSRRCEENTGPRRYLVLERDQGTKDEQAALAWHLIEEQGLPVVMIVDSGGKSLHSWLFVEGASEQEVDTLFDYAGRLGYDPATRTKSQMVRLPDGRRDNGNAQQVVWFDQAKLEGLQKGGAD